jgi:subtilisin-like proprotein convertase family protein
VQYQVASARKKSSSSATTRGTKNNITRRTTTTIAPTSISETSEPSLAITDQNTIILDIDITHPAISTLVIRLIAPDNTAVTVLNQHSSQANIVTSFPTDEFVDFTDLIEASVNGDWTIEIEDTASGDVGTLNSWGLTLNFKIDEALSTLVMESTPNGAILDRQDLLDTITVTEIKKIAKIVLHVDITHTYSGDLIIKLIGPDETSVLLRSRSGGGIDNIIADYPPSLESLYRFNSKWMNGDWILYVRDAANNDQGTLNSWSLTFYYY